MKKILLLILLFFISTSLFSETKSLQIKGFDIQAGVDDALDVSVTPIASQTEFFLIGMPFNIEEDYVRYSSTQDGRIIAHWSVLANTAFSLSIEAERLHHVDTAYINAYLDYILTFTYDMSFIDSSDISRTESGEFTYTTNLSGGTLAGGKVEDNKFIFDSPLQSNSFIGNLNGDIYFMFTQDSTDTINSYKGEDNQRVPEGNYEARVTITITAEGEAN